MRLESKQHLRTRARERLCLEPYKMKVAERPPLDIYFFDAALNAKVMMSICSDEGRKALAM